MDKELSVEAKMHWTVLPDSDHEFMLFKLFIKLFIIKSKNNAGAVIDIYDKWNKILNNSVFNQRDSKGMFDAGAIEILYQLDPQKGEGGDVQLLRALSIMEDGILKSLYFEDINTRYFHINKESTMTGQYIINGMAQPLSRLVSCKRHDFFNSNRYQAGTTLIELLMLKGKFSDDSKENEKFQEVLSILSDIDIPVDSLLEKRTLAKLKDDPRRFQFFKDNFVFVLKAALKHLDNVDKFYIEKPKWSKGIIHAINVLKACNAEIPRTSHSDSVLLFKQLVNALPELAEIKIAAPKTFLSFFSKPTPTQLRDMQMLREQFEELYESLGNIRFIPSIIDTLITIKQKYLEISKLDMPDDFVIKLDYIIHNINHTL